MIAEADVEDVAHQEVVVEPPEEDVEAELRAVQRLLLYVSPIDPFLCTNLTPAGTPPPCRNLRRSRKGRHAGNQEPRTWRVCLW